MDRKKLQFASFFVLFHSLLFCYFLVADGNFIYSIKFNSINISLSILDCGYKYAMEMAAVIELFVKLYATGTL